MVAMTVIWAPATVAAVSAGGRLSTTTTTTTTTTFGRKKDGPLLRLADFCNLTMVVSSLVVGSNVVPAWWIADGQGFMASNLGILVAFMVCSLPLGMLVAMLGVALVEGLYVLLEGRKWWRGHLLRAARVVLPSYLWGFFTFWVSTIMAIWLFNQHGLYVPPFSPLCLLGMVTGCGVWMMKVWTAPSSSQDMHGWVRERAMEVKTYLTWWPSLDLSKACLTKWKSLTSQYYQDLSPRRVLRLALNAWCPDWCGMRRYMSSRSTLKLSSLSSRCQPSLNDELDWALVRFMASTLLSVAPLIVYWFYQRFFDKSPRSLSIDLEKSWVGYYGPTDDFYQSPLPESFPIKTLQEAEHYYPMVRQSDEWTPHGWVDDETCRAAASSGLAS